MDSHRQFSYKIFLVGIPPSSKKGELVNFFKTQLPRGTKFSLHVKKNYQTGKNSGCGILKLKDKLIYKSVLDQKIFYFKTKRIFSKKFMGKQQRRKSMQDLKKRKVFIKGLPHSTTNYEIFNFFKKFGALEDAFVVETSSHKIKGRNRERVSLLYGFLIFENEENAQQFLKLKNIEFHNNLIHVSPYRTKAEKMQEELPKTNNYFKIDRGTNNIQEAESNSELAGQSLINALNLPLSTLGNTQHEFSRTRDTFSSHQTEELSHYIQHDIFLRKNGLKTYSDYMRPFRGLPYRNHLVSSENEFRMTEIEEIRSNSFQSRGSFEVRNLEDIVEVPEEGEEEYSLGREGLEEDKRYVPHIVFGLTDNDALCGILNQARSKLGNHVRGNLRVNNIFK